MSNFIIQKDFDHNSVKHGFFDKNISQSTNKYVERELDNRLKSYDEVMKNHQLLLNIFSKETNKISTTHQVHSNKIITLEEDFSDIEGPEADGMVTKNPNLVLGIYTADCVPILFADYENKVIGAAHAGWKGARHDIIQNIYNAMIKVGAKNITACIGPCIFQENYEVGPGFYGDFITEDIYNKKYFINSKRAEYFKFDLPLYVTDKLIKSGIKNIYNVNCDTYANEDKYYSFRRKTHKGGDYANNISVIKIKNV